MCYIVSVNPSQIKLPHDNTLFDVPLAGHLTIHWRRLTLIVNYLHHSSAMVRAKSLSCLIALLLSTAAAQRSTARRSTTQTPSPTSLQSSSSVTQSPEPSTTYEAIESIYSLATSLLTKYYSSTTITNLASLSWPGTLVIGQTTYTVHHPGNPAPTDSGKTTATHSPTPTAIGSEAAKNPHETMSDKKLGIILGVVIGCVALLVMAVVFFCLWRRRRNSGSFFLSRRSPSSLSGGSWIPGRRSPQPFGTTTYVSGGTPAGQREPKLPQVSVMQRRNTPPMMMHPALHEQSSRSTSDDNTFYTPRGSTTRLNHHEIDGQEIQHATELDHHEPSQRRSSSSIRDARPPTPFSPMMMQQPPLPVMKPRLHVNPFSSPEDAEADDVVSPIAPTRSPERRYSPMVHYPSWDEVSEFNFSGDESDRREDGGDGWRPRRERKVGRYELA